MSVSIYYRLLACFRGSDGLRPDPPEPPAWQVCFQPWRVCTCQGPACNILDRLNTEKRRRFERQILRSNELLLQAGQRHLKLQALPIGNPNPAFKRRVVQKKSHGKADTRGLTGAELAERALVARERAQ
jgi:hypothetical protein